MKTYLFSLCVACMGVSAWAETTDDLVAEALKNNPELTFYTAQIAALPKATPITTPEIPFPLDFPSREKLRAAVLNLDGELAKFYLDEFRFVLAGTVRLKAMEYQAATEVAASAADLAARTGALVKMREQRPVAGVTAVIERRILEGASLPFVRTAAEEKIKKSLLRAALNGLLGRKPDSEIAIQGALAGPPEPVSVSRDSALLMKIRDAEIVRGLAGLDAATAVESFGIGPWFTREGLGANEPLSGMTRPGATAGSSLAEKRARLLEDAQAKLERELAVRRLALDAAREVIAAMPVKLMDNLKSASDLAERQYRVGALGVNILIEAHREYIDALGAHNEAVIQTWRNSLDLELLQLSGKSKSNEKTTVAPNAPYSPN